MASVAAVPAAGRGEMQKAECRTQKEAAPCRRGGYFRSPFPGFFLSQSAGPEELTPILTCPSKKPLDCPKRLWNSSPRSAGIIVPSWPGAEGGGGGNLPGLDISFPTP